MGLIPGFDPPVGRSTGEGNGNLLQYSCLGNPKDRSLAGYSPWGHKQSDTTKPLSKEIRRTGKPKMLIIILKTLEIILISSGKIDAIILKCHSR